jgi:hypothetical protein
MLRIPTHPKSRPPEAATIAMTMTAGINKQAREQPSGNWQQLQVLHTQQQQQILY